jgi:phosphoenolpyruvate carboxykinase (ATP)
LTTLERRRAPGPALESLALETNGLSVVGEAIADLSVPALYEEAIRNGEGVIAAEGPLVTRTGQHTGRSPEDKVVVDEPSTRDDIWWGPVNRPLSEERFAGLEARLLEHLRGKQVYVRHGYVGADPAYRRSLRVVSEYAWHNLFASHLFIRPTPEQLETIVPDFTVYDIPSFHAQPKVDGTRSETVIALHLGRRLLVIGGTAYAGEMKKSIFTVMNYLLPGQGVLPMHCAASVGARGDVALFFGLSGTGKTSLSTDASRTLVGDDEHGWSQEGVFNFEGGCYAKLIRLSPTAEPEIYAAVRRLGAIAENVAYDPRTREMEFASAVITENTRGAYPLDFLGNASGTGRAGHPTNVIFLTADAFGVLPPVARLTTEQALYHFLSGYTAKVAGTEVGVKEPSATFSACFGAPFIPRHPAVYAAMLGDHLDGSGARVWLVNTGWTGGPYGTGHRIAIEDSRAIVDAILGGALDGVEFAPDPNFGIAVPAHVPGVADELLSPRSTWPDADAYDRKAAELAGMFRANFASLSAEAPERAQRGAPPAP